MPGVEMIGRCSNQKPYHRRHMKKLKYLQPAEYQRWLRDAQDPEWVHRDSRDRELAAFALELKDCMDELENCYIALKAIVAKRLGVEI